MLRTRRMTAGGAIIGALVVLGAGTMLYPATAAWFAQLTQAQLTTEYSEVTNDLGPEGRSAALAAAHAYNDALPGGAIVDPELERAADGSGPIGETYRQQLSLDPHGVMASVRVPSIGVDLPVFHGTSEAVLRKGVGHLFGTALPVGGAGTHAVLTAHRGLPEATLFTDLDRVALGDVVQITVYGETLTYRVVESRVVEPQETHSLYPEQGRDLVTLITCTPLGVNSHRILVTAERVPDDELAEALAAGTPMPAIPGPPWWAVGVAGSFGLAAATASATARRDGSSRRPAAPRERRTRAGAR